MKIIEIDREKEEEVKLGLIKFNDLWSFEEVFK